MRKEGEFLGRIAALRRERELLEMVGRPIGRETPHQHPERDRYPSFQLGP